ncbi:MAG: hypothetical protein SGILL_010117 [Bacillariaceae sp.]
MSDESTTESKPEDIPKPYSAWRNPNVSWTDVFISLILSYFFKMPLLTLDPESKEARDDLERTRKKLQDSADGFMGKAAVKKWADASGGDRLLAEYSGEIPFQKDILKDWKIIDDSENDRILPDTISSREKVKVLVRFPSRLLSPHQRENAEILDYSGCLEIKELDLSTFAPDTPMLLQFHGGALILGGAHKTELLNTTADLVSTHAEENGTTPPNLVTISIEYGLAPELQFPVAIMDSLSVVDYLLASTNDRKIHVSGESAGGNISCIVAMEAYRKFPGRILSLEAQCPMISPSSDSMSFYMNQNLFPEPLMLRWGWRAYLGLDAPKHENAVPTTVQEAIRKDSNYTTWEDWKGKYSKSLLRLVEPIVDLPEGLERKNAPKIIIRLNKGDPLHDEAKMLVERFEKYNSNLSYFDDMGLHCSVGGINDPDGHKQIMITWGNVLFASQE